MHLSDWNNQTLCKHCSVAMCAVIGAKLALACVAPKQDCIKYDDCYYSRMLLEPDEQHLSHAAMLSDSRPPTPVTHRWQEHNGGDASSRAVGGKGSRGVACAGAAHS